MAAEGKQQGKGLRQSYLPQLNIALEKTEEGELHMILHGLPVGNLDLSTFRLSGGIASYGFLAKLGYHTDT